MSIRRSSRLADKANPVRCIEEDTAAGLDLVYEDVSDQHVELMLPTLRTLHGSQKRKRGRSSVPAGANGNSETTPNLNIPKENGVSEQPTIVDSQCETECDNSSPGDVLGDDAEILDVMSQTPTEDTYTPKRSSKVQPAKEVTELEKLLDTNNEPQTKRGRKQSITVGEEKARGAKDKKKSKFKVPFTNSKAIKELAMANSASAELSKDDLSYMTTEEKLQLSSWGLPSTVLRNYHSKGITSLFNWQLECLANERVLEGRNLLYSAPTSAGKTLVSEILMVKRVLELDRKAIMILPFVSVAREKVSSLQSIFGDAGIRVEGFMGSVNPPGGFKAVDIAICTIEKANSLVNKLLEENSLGDLGTLVVDELHLIGNPHRGYLLELLLTKILYMTSIKNHSTEDSMNVSEGPSWRPKSVDIQIIGMSATLPNLDVLAQWLNAELYVTDFRPVPLKEHLKAEDKLYDTQLEPVREVKMEGIPVQIEKDPNDIVYLALETVLEGFSVLIFCPSKALVEQTAEQIAGNFFRIGDPKNNCYPEIGEKLRGCLNRARIQTVLDQLQQCPNGADDVLARTIGFGVGYHHAGLTYENRDIVESAYKRGILKVIVATSTLSAGVNLPARRVLISTPMFNCGVLDAMTYRQMCGRAGRSGIDTEGESILICPAAFRDQGRQLFQGQMPAVKSALLGDGNLTSSMKRALLEVIASGIASLPTDIRSYAKCTFLFHSLNSGLYQTEEELSLSQRHRDRTIDQCVEYLETQDFIRIKHYEHEDKPDEYLPTQLGSACVAASLSPDDGIIVYKELAKARECFVLENELHVIYQVTPIYVSDQLKNIRWDDYWKIWGKLDDSEKKVASLVGVKENFIHRAWIGTVSWKNPSQREDMAIHQRFFAALVLSDLVNEKSLEVVGLKYNLSKGVLQNLQQAASTFAGMVTAFCGRLRWGNLQLLLSQFQERLEFGVQRELCDLVRLDCLNGQRARILYDAGLQTMVDLAAADPVQVEHILHKATPFNSNVHGGRESSVWMIGRESLTEAEAAQKIVSEARNFIQIDYGHQGNIRFAFGNNDAPAGIASNIGHDGHLGIAASGGKNSTFLANKSTDPKPCENNSFNISANQEKMMKESNSKISESEPMSQNDESSDAGPIKKDNPVRDLNESIQDIDMEGIFSQRLEEPEEIFPMSEKHLLFEDSFPEITATPLSALYSKQCKVNESQEDGNTGTKVTRTPLPKVPRNRVQCDHYERVNDNPSNLQHSTPLVNGNGLTRRHRFNLREEEQASPVQTVGPLKKGARLRVCETSSNSLDGNCGEHSKSILEEFDKDFNSITEDYSFDFSGTVRENDTVDGLNDAKLTGNKHLIKSVVEAMQVVAEKSNFDSEELFPDGGNSSPAKNQPQVAIPYSAEPENGRDDGLEDEDFILTQGSFVSDDVIEKVENDVHLDRSSDTDYSSDSSACHHLIDTSVTKEITVHETVMGKGKLVTKIVRSADLIPSSFFSGSDLIGVGLKLVPHKKPSATIGIGAKIIGKIGLAGNALLPQVETLHSLAVYNGEDTIWVLRWENENGLRVGGSKKNTKRKNQLEELLKEIKGSGCALAIFESKEKIKSLLRHCGVDILRKLPPGERIWDPRIAQWMWEFDEGNCNVSKRKLIEEYVTEEERSISADSDLGKEVVDAFCAWKVMTALRIKLESTGLWSHYIATEMPSIMPLFLMELNGLGLDSVQLGKIKRVLQFQSALLELKAFQLAGRQFNLASPKDIKQILFRDLGLTPPKTKKTGKDVLLKLDHELPGIIVEWRKVNCALQKVVIPFQQARNLESGRVHGQYSHFTVTGRVVMSDPSLQCVPRDFDIQISYDSQEIREIKRACKIQFGSQVSPLLQQLDNEAVDAYILNNDSLISMRHAFVPCSPDFVLLTADYSQLELRILAHLSEDEKLLEALNKDTDVFIEIASLWKKLPKDKVTNAIRQDAKGIVYGVIYGMSATSLSEQMEIDEREAAHLITQFMRTYPGVSGFIEKTHKLCQEKGFVETMTGRRRYLQLVHSRNPQDKAKAFRQAVNSQIQGSAADLVKTAMARIYSSLESTYPESLLPVEWNKLSTVRKSLSFQSSSNSALDNVVFFPILNLHDELIFEVRKTHLKEIAQIIKHEMESCIKLQVKLPVVIKTGDSWGTLMKFDVD